MIHKVADMKMTPPPSSQQGMMLLEALFGILLFSIGIIALIGMQTNAAKQSIDGKYRSDASLLASELVGQMWATSRGPAAGRTAALQASFNTANIVNGVCNAQCSPEFGNWVATVTTTLPNAASNLPTIQFVQVPGATVGGVQNFTTQVTVTMSWVVPGDATVHRFVSISQL
jgi:type IV pilus assembly protein PilV